MGSDGIAVGMATKIPPHNLGELIDAVVALIDKPESTIEELIQFVKGPDFPTRGNIYDAKVIAEVYNTGRGRIIMRGKAEIEEGKSGKQQIIITELPYQVNKAEMVARIADLYHEKKLEGISIYATNQTAMAFESWLNSSAMPNQSRFSTICLNTLLCRHLSRPTLWPWSTTHPRLSISNRFCKNISNTAN